MSINQTKTEKKDKTNCKCIEKSLIILQYIISTWEAKSCNHILLQKPSRCCLRWRCSTQKKGFSFRFQGGEMNTAVSQLHGGAEISWTMLSWLDDHGDMHNLVKGRSRLTDCSSWAPSPSFHSHQASPPIVLWKPSNCSESNINGSHSWTSAITSKKNRNTRCRSTWCWCPETTRLALACLAWWSWHGRHRESAGGPSWSVGNCHLEWSRKLHCEGKRSSREQPFLTSSSASEFCATIIAVQLGMTPYKEGIRSL